MDHHKSNKNTEWELLSELIMYTHLLRSVKIKEHIVLFIIIYLLYKNKCFCDFLWIWADMLERAIHPIFLNQKNNTIKQVILLLDGIIIFKATWDLLVDIKNQSYLHTLAKMP